MVKTSDEFFFKMGIFYFPQIKRGIFFLHTMYSYYVGKVDMRLTFTHSFPTGGRSGMSTRCDWFLALSALKQRGLTWHRYEYLSNCWKIRNVFFKYLIMIDCPSEKSSDCKTQFSQLCASVMSWVGCLIKDPELFYIVCRK